MRSVLFPEPPERPVCIGCGKHPEELTEYIEAARVEKVEPHEYVRFFEGTYNPVNGHFACTGCYVAMGAPSTPRGWVAP